MTSPLPEFINHVVSGSILDNIVTDGTKVGFWKDRVLAWERGEKIAPDQEATPASYSQGMTQTLWDTLNAKVTLHLQAINLRQLADEQRERGIGIESLPVKRGVYAPRKSKPVQTTAPNSVFALGRSLMAAG